MNAKVYQFPEQHPEPKAIQGYRMSFYTDKEIDLALLCVNTWGWKEIGYTRRTMTQLDPIYIKECLVKGYNSDLLGHPGRKLINKIIDSIETIEVKVN